MTDDVRARIRRGAALLDEVEPGWRDRVAPGELDLSDCDVCVLGQLFGDFQIGLAVLGLDGQACTHGFAGGYPYSTLTAEWIAFLKGEWE